MIHFWLIWFSGGHKKVVIPGTQTSGSPVKKGKSTTTLTPPEKEKQIVTGRATSVLSPRKLVEATKISSPRRSLLASEGPSMNGSVNSSEGTTSSLVVVEPKKASPLRASLDGKSKSSPRKPVASMKSRNDESGSSPLEGETKVSPGKILLRKSTSSLPSLKSKPGLTSPRIQKLAKTRQDTPSQPGGKTQIYVLASFFRVNKNLCRNDNPWTLIFWLTHITVVRAHLSIKTKKII